LHWSRTRPSKDAAEEWSRCSGHALSRLNHTHHHADSRRMVRHLATCRKGCCCEFARGSRRHDAIAYSTRSPRPRVSVRHRRPKDVCQATSICALKLCEDPREGRRQARIDERKQPASRPSEEAARPSSRVSYLCGRQALQTASAIPGEQFLAASRCAVTAKPKTWSIQEKVAASLRPGNGKPFGAGPLGHRG